MTYTEDEKRRDLAFRVGMNYGVEKEWLRIMTLLKKASDLKELERLINE